MRRDSKDTCVVTIGHYEWEFFSPGGKTGWLTFLRSRSQEEDLAVCGLFGKECRKCGCFLVD